jgi:hypothetical protein
LIDLILSGNMVLTLYMGLLCLPFFLIFKRSMALTKVQLRGGIRGAIRRYAILPRLILLGTALAGLGVYAYGLSRSPDPRPVRRTLTEAPSEDAALRVEVADRTFLERRILEITLTARGNPIRFDMSLESAAEGSPLVIYAAPMPFTYTEEGASLRENSVEFVLGEGPPNPFTTEIVVPLDFSGSLRAEAVYAAWDPALDPLPSPENGDYALRIIRTLPIGY